MSSDYSPRLCESVARDFIDGSAPSGMSEELGTSYKIDGLDVLVAELRPDGDDFMATPPPETKVLRVGIEHGTAHVYKLPLPEFIGGVAFALASEKKIVHETATPQNIAGVCFYLGRLGTVVPSGEVNG